MAKSVTVSINGEALRNEFKQRKVVLSEASKQIGYEASYLSKAIRDEKTSLPAVNLLQLTYGINPDIYVQKEKVPETVEKVVEVLPMSLNEEITNQLHKIIYSAVYEAVKKALTE